MQSEHRLREELAAVLRDSGIGEIDDPDILDFDFEEQLGLGSIELADLIVRVGDAYGVELPTDGFGRFRRPRDLLEAIEQEGGVAAAAIDRPAIDTGMALPETPKTGAPIAILSEMEPAPATLLDALRARADNHRDHPHLKFLTADGEVNTLTFGELWDQGRHAAAGMANLGLVTAERVAILALTGPDFFVAFVGTLARVGFRRPSTRPCDSTNWTATSSVKPGFCEVPGRLHHLRSAVQGGADLICTVTPSLRESTTVAALTGGGAAPFCVESPPELALIQYTSGSTGDPKGVALTHANLLANTQGISEAAAVGGLPGDVALNWMPLYHDFGLIASWMAAGIFTGATVVMMSPVDFLTKPTLWLWAIRLVSGGRPVATTTFGLDHVARRVSDERVAGLDLSSVKFAVLGAEPVRVSAVDEFCRRFEPYGFRRGAFAPGYGLAESCVAVTIARDEGRPRVDHVDAELLATAGRAVPAPPGSRTRSLVSVGTPINGQQVRVVEVTDERLEPLAERLEGRVLVQGKSVMSGYFGRPEATALVRMGDWLDTGDLGYLVNGHCSSPVASRT